MSDLVAMRADASELRQNIETILNTDGELSVEQVSELDSQRTKLDEIQDHIHRAEVVEAARNSVERPTFEMRKELAPSQKASAEVDSRMQFRDNLRAAIRGERVEQRHDTFTPITGGAASAGSLMPLDLQDEMVRMLNSVSAVRASVGQIRSYGFDVEVPLANARGAAITAFTGEGGDFNDYSPTFTKAKLGSFKTTATSLITDELLNDSRGGVVNEVLTQHAEEHAYFWETKYLGTGAWQNTTNPDGLLATTFTGAPHAAATPTDVTSAGATYADTTLANLIDTMTAMPAQYWNLPKAWIVAPGLYTAILKLGDSSGRQLVLPQATGRIADDPNVPTLLGYPLRLSAAMPTEATGVYAAVLLESASYVIADRTGGKVDLVDPYTYSTTGEVAYNSYMRSDGRWLRPESSSRMKLG